jgi:hypothetical protein
LGVRRNTPVQRPVVGYGSVMQLKQDLVSNLSGVSSLRDFGGCFLVEGRYLLDARFEAVHAAFPVPMPGSNLSTRQSFSKSSCIRRTTARSSAT